MELPSYEAFAFEQGADRIGVLTFDLPERKVNTLGAAVLEELDGILRWLAARDDLQGLLLQSGKPGQCIAGADLHELAALSAATPSQVEVALRRGQELFRRFEQLPFPTVALIDGGCMGGGTELVLAFDERLVSSASHTSLGLPEVKIGVIPAWGGTQRLPRLVGFHHAVAMMTSGEPLSPARAAAIGLAFDVVSPENLLAEGRRLVGVLREDDRWRRRRAERERPLAPSFDELMFSSAVARGAVLAKTKGHYPAPLAALDAIYGGGTVPLDEGLAIERDEALRLIGTPIVANLVGIFFARNRLARDPGVDTPGVEPRAVQALGVVGAGLMGAGIAAAHARRGVTTTLLDQGSAELADAVRRAMQVVQSRIAIGRARESDLTDMLARLNTGTAWDLMAGCDFAIEAVTENERTKEEIHCRLAERMAPHGIIASNTSTISISRMAARLPHPERFVGMHFFHPVDRMELVEVIRGDRTDDATVATTVALARRIGKTPIVVRDCPGFLVNRLLSPCMQEAVALLVEGASPDEIDEAAIRFGMPMGPIALHDLVGLDTCAAAGGVLAAAYPDRFGSPPVIRHLLAHGRLGQKSGAGFRRFTGSKGRPEHDPALDAILAPLRAAAPRAHRAMETPGTFEETVDRLFLPMLLEATRVLEEGIVRDPSDVDMGLVLGIGFPPWRGGILRWCDTEGIARVRERVERLQSLGPRFEPSGLFTDMAREGRRFYPAV
jgi:3-hydroxyacyl-CoA dehydrogenase/enoyl-CoA hydratase/3-hydroxybutyryl-CoA epimerase/enoyl-CoA isomerase